MSESIDEWLNKNRTSGSLHVDKNENNEFSVSTPIITTSVPFTTDTP